MSFGQDAGVSVAKKNGIEPFVQITIGESQGGQESHLYEKEENQSRILHS